MIDIAIVGAGPAGLTLARALQLRAPRTVRTVVIERLTREAAGQWGRGGLLSAAAVAALRQLGLDTPVTRGTPHGEIEIRLDGEPHLLDLQALTGGVGQHVYPQERLVTDLAELYEADGGEIVWDVRDSVELDRLHTASPEVWYRTGDDAAWRYRVPDLVAGCDGWGGISRRTVAEHVPTWATGEPVDWACMLANVEPSTDHIVYGISPRGFAGHMLRTGPGETGPTARTRFYLAVPAGWEPHWETAWDELDARLDCADPEWELKRGPVLRHDTTTLGSTMLATMTYGRLALCGDAARRISPVGGKGITLAVLDATDLATAIERWGSGDDGGVREYGPRCLRRGVDVVAFNDRFARALHSTPAEVEAREWLRRICDPATVEAEDFAHRYIGTPPAPRREPRPQPVRWACPAGRRREAVG